MNERPPGSQTDNRALDETMAPGESADTNSDGDFSTEALPSSLGRYQIKELLGRGGMGAVYLAHDNQLDRDVALKVPKFDSNTNPTLVSRFYREARSAANLSHPNLCQVFDVGEIKGTHYIAMAYIKGQPLSSFVDADNPAAPRAIAGIVRKVALAMEDAHQSGIIHRDLKPANIMIDHRKEPIVMDFGLAVPQDLGDESRLTQEGALLGSPAYMSPEQLKGDPSAIGATSDIYSLGVVLYELLAGRLPFAGAGSTIAMIGQILTEDPVPLRSVRSDVDVDLAAVCHRAMSKDPKTRFGSMKDFATALGKYLQAAAGAKRLGEPAKKTATVTVSQIQLTEQAKLAKTLCESGQAVAALPILKQIVANPDAKGSKMGQWAETMLPKVEAQVAQQQTTAAGQQTVAQSRRQTTVQAGQKTVQTGHATVGANPATGENVFADLPSIPAATPATTTPYRRPVSTAKKKSGGPSVGVIAGIAAAVVLLVVGGAVAYVVLFSSLSTQTAAAPQGTEVTAETDQPTKSSTTVADQPPSEPSETTSPPPMRKPKPFKQDRDPAFAAQLMSRFDQNGDGFIERPEIPAPLITVMMAADGNGDEFLSGKELATLDRDELPSDFDQLPLPPKPPTGGPPILAELRELDADGDGKIVLSEVGLLRRQFLQRADTNRDGILDRSEIENLRQSERRRPGFGPGPGRRGDSRGFDGGPDEDRGPGKRGPGGDRGDGRPFRPGRPGN